MSNYTPNVSTSIDQIYGSIPFATPKPLSYQFQVVEFMKDGKVAKVELQVQCTTHNMDGSTSTTSGFHAVPRIQLPYIDHSN